MRKRIEKIIRKIKMLEEEKRRADKELSKLLYPFGIIRIFKRKIRTEALNLEKLSRLLRMEIKDLYEELKNIKTSN